MDFERLRDGRAPAAGTAIYLAAFALSLVPVLAIGGQQSAIAAMLLAAPWSFLFSWEMPTSASDVVGMAPILVGGLINALLVFFALRRWVADRG